MIAALDRCLVRKVRFGIDSGAAATVMRSEECGDYPIDFEEVTYRAANDTTLVTIGRRRLECTSGACVRTEVAQEGKLSKNLMCLVELVDTGHHVEFDLETGYRATHKATGHVWEFTRRGKVFDIDFDIKPYAQTVPHGRGQRAP